MSRYISGQCRTQATLFPEVLDDFISAENPIRVIDVFISELDLNNLEFQRATPKDTGRPGYSPAIMMKLYLYGYLNRIQSSRRLERETQRNVELMWLLERLSPDFKTIADFRKDNAKGIKNVCRTFVQLCRKMHMFNDAVVAIDGSKFKAVNNKRKNYTPKKVDAFIERVEKHIASYMNELDKADREDAVDNTPIQEKIDWLKTRLDELNILKEKVNSHPDKQVSTTDPDSRLMKVTGMIRQVGYNLQSAVDTQHHLIVSHKVTNIVTDRGQLFKEAKRAQSALGQMDITVLADKGYYSGQDIKDTLDAGMKVFVPKGDTSSSQNKGIFHRNEFRYDKAQDAYICPANKVLKHRFDSFEHGLTLKKYFSDNLTCRACEMQQACSTSKSPRRLTRWEHEEVLEKMELELKSKPDSMLIRKQTVEHPFGTIKAWMGASHFLTKGLTKVNTEMNLFVLAYNLKRMISIFGTAALINKLMA